MNWWQFVLVFVICFAFELGFFLYGRKTGKQIGQKIGYEIGRHETVMNVFGACFCADKTVEFCEAKDRNLTTEQKIAITSYAIYIADEFKKEVIEK